MPEGKGEWVANEQNRTTVHDNSGLCLFAGASGGPLDVFLPCAAAATGIPWTMEDAVRAGERTWNLERLWNMRAGLTKDDDSLPERLLKEALKDGPSAGVTVQLDVMLAAYYRERGWDEQGVPTEEKLAELGLASL